MLSRLRNFVAPLRRRMAAPLVARKLAPDAVTLSAIPLSCGAAALIVARWTLCGLALALAAALVDFVDGEVARAQQRTSRFGDLLDATVDRVVEGVLLAALAVRWPLPATLALMFGGLVSYIKARVGLIIVADNRDWPGLGDRTDRLVLILLAVLLGAASFATCGGARGARHVLWLLVGVSAVGCLQRLQHARAEVAQAAVGAPSNPARRG